MANAFKNTTKVANRLLLILKNQLVMGKLVDTRFNTDFPGSSGNGEVPIGDTVTIRRAPKFTATDGATFSAQDIVVGSTSLTIDKQKHVGFTLTDFERILQYDGDSFLKDAVANARMNSLANKVETDCMAELLKFPGWVGTAGNSISTIAGFNKMPERLDNMAVPQTDRNAVLSVTDYWALMGAFTGTIPYDNSINQTALQKAKLPMIGNVDAYMANSVPTLTTGTRTDGAVNGASQSVTYATAKDTYTQTLILDGVGASKTIKAGEVFVLGTGATARNAVNPITGADLGYQQQFTVTADATSDGSGNVTVTITPPIISSGAYATVASAVADNDAVTWVGTASTSYRQNATFHKGAIALAWVRPAKPESGTYSYAEDPETGISLRLWGFSDGSADTHSYRADIIYGVKNIDNRLGVRGNGA